MATHPPPSSSSGADWVTAPLTARDIRMDVHAQQAETRVESLAADQSHTTNSLQPCPSSSRLGDQETTTTCTLQPAAASHLDDMEVTEFTAPAQPTKLLNTGAPEHASAPQENPSPGHAAVPTLNLEALDHEAAKWQPKEAATAAPPLPAQTDLPGSAAPDPGSPLSPHDLTDTAPTTPGHPGAPDPRQDSAVSGISTFGSKLRRASETFKTALTGDNDDVVDKWDNYDDDLEEEIEAAKKGAAGKHYRRRSSRSGDAKVLPYSPAGSASRKFLSSMDGTSLTDPNDLLGEKRSSRTLIWHYSQTFLFSMLLTAVCIPLVALVSMVKWHESEDMPQAPAGSAANGTAPTASFHGVRPNHQAMQLMLLFQIIFPLCIYAVLLYACIRRSLRLPWPMIALVCFTMAWATLVCGLFYKFDVAFWFYYIDLFLIVAAYVPCMCMVGWYVEVDEQATVRHRLMDVFFTAILETVVAAATLVYCFFIMPLFFMLTNAWLQMLWLCVLHPLYFEATTGFIVRKMLKRNRQQGRNHILYLLTIVHSMVHVVVLATSLQASIEPVRILALTVFLYNLSKLTWRSTVLQRDLFIERMMHGWSFNYSIDELAELSRMVSVGIITEIILENASIFIAPFLMFRMYKEPIFMAVVPNTFFNNGGTYPVKTLLVLIAMLMVFTMVFDLIFYFLNYHMVQHLPLINTWRRIKRSQGWYLAFLIYAFMTMGVLFLFLTMMILPRAAYCKSDNYCDCATLTYRTICEGQYISTLVDYLV